MDAIINYQNSHDKRVRDMGTFKYTLRSLAKNANIFDNVYLIYDGNDEHIPEYIDTNKIKLIKHEEFIPEKFLPTFNQHVVEYWLHRAPISLKFVYIKEDTFFLKELCESDFFVDKKIVLGYTVEHKNSGTSLGNMEVLNSSMMYYLKNGAGVKNVIVPEKGAVPMLRNFNNSVQVRFEDMAKTLLYNYEKRSDFSYEIFPIGMILKGLQVPGSVKRGFIQTHLYDKKNFKKELNSCDSDILYIDSTLVNSEQLFNEQSKILTDFLSKEFNEPCLFEK